MLQFAIIITLIHNLTMPQRKSPSVKSVPTAKPKRAAVQHITLPAASTRAATESNEDERLNAIEARLAALETQQISIDNAANTLGSAAKLTIADDRYWALNELNRQSVAKPDDRGAVLYAGTVSLPSGAQYVWQRQDSTRELIEGDWRDLSETIAALSHPMRLEILKHALGQDRSTQDFMALPDMGTTGQLFHHIKALQDAGWLRSLQRGLYGVPGERVVPLLAILAAARG
jgi:DNA-binding transcriptional ArsR family regulator